jgi:hypothetical protein
MLVVNSTYFHVTSAKSISINQSLLLLLYASLNKCTKCHIVHEWGMDVGGCNTVLAMGNANGM